MPRVARKKSNSGYYHVVLRGINKQIIFYDDEDRKVFLNRLKEKIDKNECKIVAFCLMTNHVHLLIKEENMTIGNTLRKVFSSYVYWYNSKYERVGHLFQDRFKSEPIETEEYLLCCTRYILQNPVEAKMVENLWSYKWSSASLLLKDENSFVDGERVKDILQEQLISFMEEQNEDKYLEWESKIKLTDEKLKGKIIEKLKINKIDDILQMSKENLEGMIREIMSIEGANILQVSRITGVPYHIIRQEN